MSEGKFHKFLIRSGIEADLGGDGACGLIERMDPRATGYIRYNKFLDLVRFGKGTDAGRQPWPNLCSRFRFGCDRVHD